MTAWERIRVFDHEPKGCPEHDMTLHCNWDTDEPEMLSCEICGIAWSIGPRVNAIPYLKARRP